MLKIKDKMELKKYQQKAIDKLNEFLDELETFKFNPRRAFISTQSKEEETVSYNESSFGEIPFICMKLPTGGGKTLVACQSIIEILDRMLKDKLDKGIVIWFTPSEAIKSQTLTKLRDKTDIHRQVLERYFNGNIKVFSNEEALRIRKEDVQENLCIIISSLDAFRKEEQKRGKYKVYQENGELLPHFENIKEEDYLERDEENTVKYSLANVVRLSNPLIVIDEGHKTKTQISINFLKSLNPSFIIEYTATPRAGSNILVNIHSQELKIENMVKIPIVLESSREWQSAIDEGFVQLMELEKLAKKDDEYIRPLALFQAQQEKEDTNKVTVSKIKNYLIKEKKVPEEQIAIKTSKNNELIGINLFSKRCKIRYIITVSALAEGWDCSFAYVLVSVANLGAKIAVEQVIGRIVRMPYAKRRKHEDLNRCYIFASSRNFNEAADQIIKGLEDNGYSKLDLVNRTEKDKKSPFEVSKVVKEDLGIPVLAFENEELSFGEHLLTKDFELKKQDYKFDFIPPCDSDGRAIIDIEKGDKWRRGKQTVLNLGFKEKNPSEKELILWLDRKLRFSELGMEDKIEYIRKSIKYQLDGKKKTLQEISVNRYSYKEKLEEQIKKVMEEYAKKNFDKFLKVGKIRLKVFDKFPDKIALKEEIRQDYNKNFYERIDKLNREEKGFIDRIDLSTLPNIKFWVRCREKQKDSFALQGWERRRFYPDFVAVTNKWNIIAFEWKGEDRKDNPDTKYKEEVGKIWAKLGNGKLYFFLVHNGNVGDVLKETKKIE